MGACSPPLVSYTSLQNPGPGLSLNLIQFSKGFRTFIMIDCEKGRWLLSEEHTVPDMSFSQASAGGYIAFVPRFMREFDASPRCPKVRSQEPWASLLGEECPVDLRDGDGPPGVLALAGASTYLHTYTYTYIVLTFIFI